MSGSAAACTGTINVDDWLDRRSIRGVQWLVFISCSIAMMTDGYDLQTLSLAAPEISRAWGIQPADLTWAFSFSMIGMGLGAAFIGSLGDRYGRKTILIAALLLVSAGCYCSGLSQNAHQLSICRLVTGLGIGAVNVNAMALTTDFSPPRRRFLIVTSMVCSVAVGASVASFSAPSLIAGFGWQSLFTVGSVLALVIAIFLWCVLPESISFLLKKNRLNQVSVLAAKIDPDIDASRFARHDEATIGSASIKALFEGSLAIRTISLWLVYALGTFCTYLLMSWLPTLLSLVGWADSDAMRGSASIQIGGIVGAIVVAMIVDRGYLVGAMVSGYAVAAIALILIVALPANLLLWSILLFFVGVGATGNQLVLNGASSALYPPHLRATSNGWASAVARIGAVLAPIVGGATLALGIEPAWIIGLLAIPMIIQMMILVLARQWFKQGAHD